MKRTTTVAILALMIGVIFGVGNVAGQGRTTFTGSILMYGSRSNTRTTSHTFTLRINRETSDADAARFLAILQDRGQDALLDEINDQDLGSLTIGGRLAPRINAVRIDDLDGKKRVRVIFARWMSFAELRGGYRSTDYPFGYMEIVVDPRTGNGDGTYFAAAKIRFRSSRNEVEVEDFSTFPGRLMGVKMRGSLP